MKKFLKKAYFYIINKYVVWDYRRKIIRRSTSVLINAKEFKDYYTGAKTQPSEFILEFKDGLKIICNHTDLSAVAETCILQDYSPNPEFQIHPGMVVLDIGANIGDFTVWAAKQGACVLAFEPEPRNVKRMQENIALNHLQDLVTIVPAAVFTYSGKININVSTHSAGGHAVKLGQESGGEQVDCVTLEDFLAQRHIDAVDLLKIDVEGAEYEIIHSIKPEVFSKIRRIVGEYHMGLETNNNFKTLKNILMPYYIKVERYYPYYFYAQKGN